MQLVNGSGPGINWSKYNQRTSLVITYDSSFVPTSAYSDGQKLNFTTISNSWSTSGTTFCIGSRTNDVFNGEYCALRIYNRELTEAEILQNYEVDR